MTQPATSVESVYERCDPAYLRDLREAAGVDIHILARNACLSVGQVRELESGKKGNFFYSDTIKRQAYKRVLMQLGAEPPTASSTNHPSEPPQDLNARLAPLDSIVAMSHRPSMERSVVAALQPLFEKLQKHKSTLGLFILLALAFTGMTQYMSKHISSASKISAQAVIAPNHVAVASQHAPALAVVAAPAASIVASSTPVAAVSEFKCAYTNEAMPQWTPAQARKEGRYVYLVSDTTVAVCVVDGQKRASYLQMKAGESRSVYGSAPWQISGGNLQKIKIYFQGGLVTLPDGTTPALSLVEAPVTP